jgi:hypothetical protein
MTPEQARELNRIAVKAEALQDNFTDQGFKGLKITGQMDPTWIYNKRQGDATFVFLNNGGARYTYDNSYFGMAVLDFEKETESGTRWHLTLAPERGTGALINGGSIVHEASVSIPLGDLQTRLWLGQIPDWTGYEITLPAGNKLITHNLLFDFMAPTAYTGAVMDVTSGKWWVRASAWPTSTPRATRGQQGAGADLPRRLLQGRIRRLRLQRRARQGAQLRRRRHLHRRTDADNGDDQVGFASAGKNTSLHLLEFDAYYIRGDWSLYGQVSYGQQKRPPSSTATACCATPSGGACRAPWATSSSRRAWKASCAPTTSTTRRTAAACWATATTTASTASAAACWPMAASPRAKARHQPLRAVAGPELPFDENTTFKVEYRLRRRQPAGVRQRRGHQLCHRKTNHLLGASMVVSF